ncbi:unnamed protein product [Linum tenue]|uniref:F-box domain-containing protein n=1 Tax=Linum tenue TaxID=586396 RepID=A0AAV0NJX5_9ROSI|nr:unnamed protein product [Linum tenue]
MVKKKMPPKPKVDRISKLPVHLIQLILTSLPIKEAGRTSVLSREWRHHWKSITHLVFDKDFDSPDYSDSDEEISADKLMSSIQKTLQVHDGPITECVVSNYRLTTTVEIDPLISHLIEKGVSRLSLLYCCRDDSQQYEDEIDPSLFRAVQVDRLKLQGCELVEPSWFTGFTRLTSLHLDIVGLPEDFFDSFLLNCPLLEDLRVFYFRGLNIVEVEAPPRLKVCILRADLGLVDISFSYAPLLSVVSIHAEECGDEPETDVVSLFASLPALQRFYISFECLELLAAGSVPDRLPVALHCLEVLDIRRCDDEDSSLELELVLCLIRSSPNLNKLTIKVGLVIDTLYIIPFALHTTVFTVQAFGFLWDLKLSEREPEAHPEDEDSFCQHLDEVEIRLSGFSQVELDLLRFVLANAPLLRRIVIQPKSRLRWEKCLKFLGEIKEYDCASKNVEIIYVNKSGVMFFSMRLANV